ncbi:hypothetical protein K437DRAFT_295591 [Tilletiaria anomala UBC 951]|uniref:Uncharacterized protein n=1 Tax=Tilletiaria anomala (strain ATCC 24038 / CBS 436.72 / UBC 951) TaxID=1037660 RepID=A0A066VJ66_TILAU|nr:uncharacterized protein K437DRAFT_295591 [Tilletiaria anomala UBC 951]KDN41531.1 hypothetical protein K437DRAFT_295591 [Tilletiaria anomala UBC 951]
MASSSLPILSPLVTRILEVSGFSSDLKTRDISSIFATWEDDRGGFKIKWVDDTTVLIIFADPATTKKAYLNTLLNFPPALIDASGKRASIKPYDGDDASTVIASVHRRTRSRSNAANLAGFPNSPSQGTSSLPGGVASSPQTRHRHTGSNVSISTLSTAGSLSRAMGSSFKQGHLRHPSGSNPSSLPPKPIAAALYDAANGGPSPAHHLSNTAREQGVPLPLAAGAASTSGRSTLSKDAVGEIDIMSGTEDASGSNGRGTQASQAGRVGDAGKRLVAGALGVRHPGLESRADGKWSPSASDAGSAPACGDTSAAASLPQGMDDLTIR